MRYLSVCSGIEAASVAWEPLGWQPAAFSEIEPFPRAVLAHRFPDVPVHGDFTTIRGDEYGPVQLLVGGTPCQSFSVAGLRKGLDDPRGNLALGYLALAERLGARWLVWENVPGVLSSNGGRDFGAFLGGLGQLGYGFAYRVLDAQYFGLAQRRRRVFVVAHLGDWRPAAAVLFERHSLQGHPAPSREEGAGVAGLTARGVGTCGADDNQAQAGRLIPAAYGRNNTSGPIDTAGALTAKGGSGRMVFETETFVAQVVHGTQDPDALDNLAHPLGRNHGQENAVCITGSTTHALTSEGHDASKDGTGRGTPVVAFGISSDAVDRSGEGDGSAGQRAGLGIVEDCSPAIRARPNNSVATGMAVRRLTPRECERLQGFPDDWTLVPYRGKPAADGPRYRALGNSMAVPVMAWIGRRIAEVDGLIACREAAE